MVSSGMENRQIYLIYFFPNAEDIIQAIISVLLSDRNSLSDTKNIFLVCYKEILKVHLWYYCGKDLSKVLKW